MGLRRVEGAALSAIRKGLRLPAQPVRCPTECDQRSRTPLATAVSRKAIHPECSLWWHIFDDDSGCAQCRTVRRQEFEHVKYVSGRLSRWAPSPGHIGSTTLRAMPGLALSLPAFRRARWKSWPGLMTRSGMNTIALKDARGAVDQTDFQCLRQPGARRCCITAATRFGHRSAFRRPDSRRQAVAKARIALHGDPRQLVRRRGRWASTRQHAGRPRGGRLKWIS